MLMLPANIGIFVASEPVDMRKGFDGLCGLIKFNLQQDPLKASMFVFFNRSCDKVKIMYWERNGFAIWYKRLAKGKFRPPKATKSSYKISLSDLTCLLEGIDLLDKQRLAAA
jgi:transposase